MQEMLFLLAFLVLAEGGHLGGKVVNANTVNRPRDPRLLNALSGFATLASIGYFIWGFFPFSWWLPLIGLLLFSTAGAWITFKSQRSRNAPLIAMLFVCVGTALAVWSVASA